MPRNATGTYTLPNSAYVTGTVISSAVTNSNLSDIATALTQSVATTGVSTLIGQLPGFAGTVAAPGFTMPLDTTTGFYRKSANVWAYASGGVEVFDLSSAGITMISPAKLKDRTGLEILAIPIGSIWDYAGSSAPTGWFLCNGQAVSQTTYAALFAVISTTYGNPGGGNFNVPDCRGRVTACLDNLGGTAASRLTNAATNGVDGSAIANVGGLQNITLAQANLPNYTLTNTLAATMSGSVRTDGTALATNLGAAPEPNGLSNSAITATVTGSVTSGGSGTALNLVQPTIIVQKIIYHGVFP